MADLRPCVRRSCRARSPRSTGVIAQEKGGLPRFRSSRRAPGGGPDRTPRACAFPLLQLVVRQNVTQAGRPWSSATGFRCSTPTLLRARTVPAPLRCSTSCLALTPLLAGARISACRATTSEIKHAARQRAAQLVAGRGHPGNGSRLAGSFGGDVPAHAFQPSDSFGLLPALTPPSSHAAAVARCATLAAMFSAPEAWEGHRRSGLVSVRDSLPLPRLPQ
jgi:hypothetical protein